MMFAEGIRIRIGQLKRYSKIPAMSRTAAKGREGGTNLRLTGRVVKPTVYLPSGAMPKP